LKEVINFARPSGCMVDESGGDYSLI
jgi:hypothetical protein